MHGDGKDGFPKAIFQARGSGGSAMEAVISAYRRYAPWYDAWFGPILNPGRKVVVERMRCAPGEMVLEVGVGTGLSLPLYDSAVRVVGIDISMEMLEKARELRRREFLLNVVALEEMNAEKMTYRDNTFDKVVAMYVASVVPDPVAMVREMQRVCKPGGEIFIVNHFRSAHPLLHTFEKGIAPLSSLLGFKPDFSMDEFLKTTGLPVLEKIPVNLFGYWTMLRSRNEKE